MHTINRDFDRLDDDVIEAFRAYATPILSDVLEKNRRTMHSRMKPVYRDASVVGSALTVDAQPGDNLVLHRAISLAQDGDVIVVNADDYSEAGIWGELMTRSAIEAGVAGTVIEGAVRDVTEIADLEYGAFSTHVSPKGSNKALEGSINVPVSCGGVVVEPGDIVVGDANGVVAVPADEAASIIDECDEKLAAEAAHRDAPDVSSKFTPRFEEILSPLEQPTSDRD